VTLTDYLAGSTTTGSYSTSTHLFQTGLENSLPMPIYGVDPTASHALWGLTAPESGPATFLVGGNVWRFIGEDGNGGALYQGYYSGQQLTLGAAGVAPRAWRGNNAEVTVVQQRWLRRGFGQKKSCPKGPSGHTLLPTP